MMSNNKIKIKEVISKYSNFLILTHVDPDCDAIGSSLALYWQLRSLNKEVNICVERELGSYFQFLPGVHDIHVGDCSQLKADIIITLDTANLNRVSGLTFLSDQSIHINIDHHHDNSRYGEINYISEYSSVGETLTYLFNEFSWDIDQNMATCLYAAICSDTGRFQYSNVTASTLYAGYLLLKTGICPYSITRELYERFSQEAFDLIKVALENLVVKRHYSYTVVPNINSDFKVIDFIRKMDGPSVVLVFQFSEDWIKVNLRSKSEIDVSEIARQFNGGGHKKAAGIRFSRGEHTVEEVVNRVSHVIDKMYND